MVFQLRRGVRYGATTLSSGTHTITAILSIDGNSNSAQTSVTIVNDRPHLTIDSPISGRTLDIDELVHFEGTVLFQGVPAPASLSWISDIDGSIGSGMSFDSANLSEGKHDITVTVSMNGETDIQTLFSTIYDSQKNLGDENEGQCFGGNPINLISGNKYHEEVDFSTSTELPLYLKRSYNSNSMKVGLFGVGWSSNIEERVEHNVAAQQASVVSDTGAIQRFDLVGGVWVDVSSSKGQLEQLGDNGWRYTLFNKTVKTYNPQGQILSVTSIAGLSQTFNYVSGLLDTLSDEYG